MMQQQDSTSRAAYSITVQELARDNGGTASGLADALFGVADIFPPALPPAGAPRARAGAT